MAYENILLDINEGVARLTLNRPDSLNSINKYIGEELVEALTQLRNDDAVRVVVLTGAGRAFSSGGDIKGMLKSASQSSADLVTQLIGTLNGVTTMLGEMPKPVLAAINGPCAGIAFNFALACDIRVATKSATFTQAFINIGLIPDGGGTYLLPRVVGWSRATEMILTGRIIQTDEALQVGIVHQVVEDSEFAATVEGLARRLAKAPTGAIGYAKQLLKASYTNTLEAQLQLELETQMKLGGSHDFLEGIAAFVEKRKPNFNGK